LREFPSHARAKTFHVDWLLSRGRMKDCAQGCAGKNVPVRMSPGILAAEAHAVKSGTTDMPGFMETTMQVERPGGKLQRAIADTRKE
jgi:beta-lactamase class C